MSEAKSSSPERRRIVRAVKDAVFSAAAGTLSFPGLVGIAKFAACAVFLQRYVDPPLLGESTWRASRQKARADIVHLAGAVQGAASSAFTHTVRYGRSATQATMAGATGAYNWSKNCGIPYVGRCSRSVAESTWAGSRYAMESSSCWARNAGGAVYRGIGSCLTGGWKCVKGASSRVVSGKKHG